MEGIRTQGKIAKAFELVAEIYQVVLPKLVQRTFIVQFLWMSSLIATPLSIEAKPSLVSVPALRKDDGSYGSTRSDDSRSAGFIQSWVIIVGFRIFQSLGRRESSAV